MIHPYAILSYDLYVRGGQPLIGDSTTLFGLYDLSYAFGVNDIPGLNRDELLIPRAYEGVYKT